MKRQILIAVALVAITALTGCAGQTGGTKFSGLTVNKNGIKVLALETAGAQVAVGGQEMVDRANERFNRTVSERNEQAHIEATQETMALKERNEQAHREKIVKTKSSLIKTLVEQGKSTEEIQTLTQDFLARKK